MDIEMSCEIYVSKFDDLTNKGGIVLTSLSEIGATTLLFFHWKWIMKSFKFDFCNDYYDTNCKAKLCLYAINAIDFFSLSILWEHSHKTSLYYISLFSKIRCSLTYLPTYLKI